MSTRDALTFPAMPNRENRETFGEIVLDADLGIGIVFSRSTRLYPSPRSCCHSDVQPCCTILFTAKGKRNSIINRNMADIGESTTYEPLPVAHSDSDGESDLEFGELKTHQEPQASTSGVNPNFSRHYTAAEERSVICKLDRTVVFFTFLLCLASLSDLTSTCSIISSLN